MANVKRSQNKDRFSGIPFRIIGTEQYTKLGSAEVKLLIDLLYQYNGRNNGMLSPCHALLKKQGWAKSSLYRAYANLVHKGFIVVTRKGWKVRGKATFVAVTWNGIDEPIKCEYDKGITVSSIPLSYWCKAKISWQIRPTIKQP